MDPMVAPDQRGRIHRSVESAGCETRWACGIGDGGDLGHDLFVAPFTPPSYRERLTSWLADDEELPLEAYRDRPRVLVNRIAASVLLGRDLEPYRAQFEALVADLDARPPEPVLGRGNLAAAALLLTGNADADARRCLDDYRALPGSGSPGAQYTADSDCDDMALAVARLLGDQDAAVEARARRVRDPSDTSTMVGAELLFLADRTAHDDAEALLLSAVRGIVKRITVNLNGSSAPFLCAFGAVAGGQVRARLAGQIDGYDALSRSADGWPFLVTPQRIELPADRPVIRLVAAAAPTGRIRLDAVDLFPLVGGLRDMMAQLKRALDAPGRRRFQQLRKRTDTVLELAIEGAEATGEDIFRDRVTAALDLMAADGSARCHVVTTYAR
jgi:hypothetical protein